RIISAIASEGVVPDKVVERIFLKTEGSPLFIEEMTKGLLESGLLTLRDGRYVDSGAFSSFTIPDTIYGPLRSRLDQLGKAKKTAQIGSVIGREFPFRLLLRASGLTPARLSHDLERLTRSGLVLQTGTPPESVYSFKHALIQEAAYQALLKTTRRELHLAIASALQEEEGGSGKVAPEILAQHFASGGDPRSAIRFWRLAARLAFERSALTEAERHLECALETIGELDECPETRRLKLEVITQLGSALRSTRGYAAVEIESLYLEARALCQQIGETPERFNVEWALMQIYLVQGKLNKVNDAAIWLFSYAAEHDDRSVRMDACLANGMAKLHQGNIADACTYLKQSVALYRPENDVPRVPTHGQDPGVFAQGFYHWTLWFLGYPDKARAEIKRTVARAREISHTFSLVSALTFAVRVHHCLRDSTAVKTLTEELVGLSHANGYTYYEAGALIHQGWALAMEDEAVRGLAQMCEALAVLEKNGTVLGLRGFLIQLAEGYMRLGMKEEALRALDKAEREGGSHCWDAEVYRVRGEVHARGTLSERQRAEEQFSAGLEIARRQGARSLELRTATCFARALQQWGREGEADRLLGPCLAEFNEGWECADLIEAAAITNELRQMSGG
ncbi:MAG: hypothetical protein D6773_05460, partial [Alphaproteobacteria bacterium]